MTLGMTMTFKKLLIAASALLALGSASAWSAEGAKHARDIPFSFEGPFGTFDRAQLQRGFKIYKEVCSACHAMSLLSYRNLSEPGGPEFTEEQVKGLAASYEVQAGPNEEGEMFARPGLPSDRFASPFPNPEAAKTANGGSYPPDLSLITKSRPGWDGTFKQLVSGIGGPEYVYSVLTGYEEYTGEEAGPDGKAYNPYFSAGPWIGMGQPLSDGQVDFDDGAPNTTDAMARDVSAFLAWAAEPKMEERKRTGLMVMIYLAVLSVLLYLVKQKVWRNVEH
jgi:ubiquinol-cytochrome c reductase cytochrome c1 subunit